MTTFRVARRRHYKPIDVRTLNDERLSFRARGVLVFLLSKPDDWTFTAESISTCGTEGRDAIRAVLGELSVCGYLVQTKRRDGGRFITDSVLYEHPEDAPPERETSAGEPGTVNQHRKTRPSTEASLRDAETEDGNRIALAPLALVDNRFDVFWEAYPRKEGKRDAHKVFDSLMKTTDAEDIMDGLAEWCGYWTAARTEPSFIKTPAPWLRGERWKERPPSPAGMARSSNLATFDRAAIAYIDQHPVLELGR